MGAGGSKEIALRLKQNGDARVINLEGKTLDDEAIDILVEVLRDPHVRSTVRCLRLGGCGLDGYRLQRIAEALVIANEPTHLKRLELTMHNNKQVANPIGDVGSKSLAMIISRSHPHLQHVVAAGCGIGDHGVKYIAQSLINNGHLLTLDLSNNSISEKGAEEIGKALELNYHLKGLLLWKNRIFHTGAEALVEGLMGNGTLESLGLGCNHIGDAGAQAFAQLLLSEQSKLKWLALGANNISVQGARYLGVGLRAYGPRALKQAARQLQGYAHPSPILRRHPSMTSSMSSRSQGYLDDVTEEESNDSASYSSDEEETTFCCSLESLGLGGNNIRDEGARAIAEGLVTNTKLVNIGLGDNRIGNQGAKALADLIRSSSTLHTAILSGNSIRDEGASQLIASLSQNSSLKQLFLANNPFGDDVIVRCLEVIGKYNQTLEKLDIHGTHVTREQLEALVLGLKESGVVRMLGSERLPASLKGHTPSSGNMMELAAIVPRDSIYQRASLPSRKTGIFSDQPFRQPMSAFLTSLPQPEETAQSLVMKERRRRNSISNMFRKFSKSGKVFRKGEVVDIAGSDPVGYQNMAATEQPPARRVSRGRQQVVRSTGAGAYEMTPLVEESLEETSDQFEIARTSVFQSSTVVLGDESVSDEDGDMPPSPSESLRKYSFARTEPVERDHQLPAKYTRKTSLSSDPRNTDYPIDVNVELLTSTSPKDHSSLNTFDIPHAPSLNSITKERAPLPPGRRKPTRYSSPLSSTSSDTPTGPTGLERWKGQRLPSGGMRMGVSPEPPPTLEEDSDDNRSESENNDKSDSGDSDGDGDGDHEGNGDGEGDGDSDGDGDGDGDGDMEDIDATKLPEFRQSVMSASSDIGTSKILSKSVPIQNSLDPELTAGTQVDEKSLKEQWSLALAMRVGILKMGGFLHSVYDGIERSSKKLEQDFTAASLPVNKYKNRPEAPLPPGHTRVKMNFCSDLLGSEYINASYVGPPGLERTFIVTQGPLEETVGDFWRLIWEEGIRSIVMLTEEFEKGKKLCEKYWPDSDFDDGYSLVVSGSFVDDCLSVSLANEESSSRLKGVIVRTFLLTSSLDRSTREVKQYQFLGWPQHGTCENPEDIASLIVSIDEVRKRTPTVPIVVHSSLGSGRAGCFVTVAIAKMMIQSAVEPLTWDSDSNLLDQVIRGIRTMRPGLVENSQQFDFCHLMLEQALWGRVAKEMAQAAPVEKTKKWWQFKRKEKNKPPKAKKEKKLKKSKSKPVTSHKEDRRNIIKNLDDADFLY